MLPFVIAHGTGNDFVVLEDLEDRLEVPVRLVRALTDRRRGLGGDGLIRIAPGGADADVFMDYRNADGSVGEMCGNGVRVVAKLVVDQGAVTPVDDVVRVGTRAGTRAVRVTARHADGRVAEVAVDMGRPVLEPDAVPFDAEGADADTPSHRLLLDDGEAVELAVVSMGNPHGVLVVDDVDTAEVARLGPRIETHRRFPAKVNVGFAQVVDPGHLRLRVWERGVGETAACGTGACAAVVALQRTGRLSDEVVVRLPGGRLTVQHAAGGTVIMRGPAVEVARGVLDDGWLAAVRRGDPEVDAP